MTYRVTFFLINHGTLTTRPDRRPQRPRSKASSLLSRLNITVPLRGSAQHRRMPRCADHHSGGK